MFKFQKKVLKCLNEFFIKIFEFAPTFFIAVDFKTDFFGSKLKKKFNFCFSKLKFSSLFIKL